MGFRGEQTDRVGPYTSVSASQGGTLGFDWTPVLISQVHRFVSKHSILSSGLHSLSSAWLRQSLPAPTDLVWKLLLNQKQLHEYKLKYEF